MREAAGAPRWLSVCRHRVRRVGYPYLLVLQHHIIPSVTRIVAPVAPARGRSATLLVPHLNIGADAYRIMLLELASVAIVLIGETVEAAVVEADAVADGLDAIFRGYPVGMPFN